MRNRPVFCLLCMSLLVVAQGPVPAAEGRDVGARVPFVTYDCDDTSVFSYSDGVSVVEDDSYLCREAYNRKCVALAAPGQFLEFTATAPANSILVRYSLPFFTPRDERLTLSVYVNGVHQKDLVLSSYYLHADAMDDNQFLPAEPDTDREVVRRWWEETHVTDVAVEQGDRVRLQQDAGDVRGGCFLDLVDLELVPPPSGDRGRKPDDTWQSLVEHGAVPNDRGDDRDALLAAIRAAVRSGHRRVWVPPGEYQVDALVELDESTSGITIAGPGMWHATLRMRGERPRGFFKISADDVTLRDLRLDYQINYRRISINKRRWNGGHHLSGDGDGLRVERVWFTHRTAAWYSGNHGVFAENRVRGAYADGIHVRGSASENLVTNNHIRSCGDDGLAHWSSRETPGRNNRFLHNTIECGYMGRGMAFFGGDGNVIEANRVKDGWIELGLLLRPEVKRVATDPIRNCIARDNLLDGAGNTAAIEINAKTAPIQADVVGNTILNARADGIYVRGQEWMDVRIADNRVANSAGEPLRNLAEGAAIEFRGNVFRQSPE